MILRGQHTTFPKANVRFTTYGDWSLLHQFLFLASPTGWMGEEGGDRWREEGLRKRHCLRMMIRAGNSIYAGTMTNIQRPCATSNVYIQYCSGSRSTVLCILTVVRVHWI